ncbi:glycosyl transferase family 90 [Devosia sp.]|uniref:glycosyl transferase family 90 n=1 Tax=Devosia sp. TaxID=1871048 RepID=UPI003A929563
MTSLGSIVQRDTKLSPAHASKKIANDLHRPYLVYRVWRETQRQLAGRLVPLPKLRVQHDSDARYGLDAVFRREADTVTLTLSISKDIRFRHAGRKHSAAYLYWFAHCDTEVEMLSVTLSDGESPSGARFAPSTGIANMIPLPDPHFFQNYGFSASWRAAEVSSVDWHERSSDIVWRGTNSGSQSNDPQLVESAPHAVTPRIRLCLALRAVAGTDVKLSRANDRLISFAALQQFGITGDPIPESSWLGRKFAIDVDGNTNTWSNLLIRLHFGCCVLKVESEHGYRQWYYDRLIPWEHYVPIKPDMSDLLEQIDWVRSHDTESQAIAANGQALARSLTFDSVRSEAVELITENWTPY